MARMALEMALPADVIPPRHRVLDIFAAHRQAFNALRANGPQHGDLVPVQNIIRAKRVFRLHADCNVVNSKEKVQEFFSGNKSPGQCSIITSGVFSVCSRAM